MIFLSTEFANNFWAKSEEKIKDDDDDDDMQDKVDVVRIKSM
jgi:hypothetical protein